MYKKLKGFEWCKNTWIKYKPWPKKKPPSGFNFANGSEPPTGKLLRDSYVSAGNKWGQWTNQISGMIRLRFYCFLPDGMEIFWGDSARMDQAQRGFRDASLDLRVQKPFWGFLLFDSPIMNVGTWQNINAVHEGNKYQDGITSQKRCQGNCTLLLKPNVFQQSIASKAFLLLFANCYFPDT